jgi:dipeptidyl aminopeptidase/acylaminoacyl peptidase
VPVKRLLLWTALAVLVPWSAGARPLVPDDWYRFQALEDLTLAADGSQVAYLVTSYDKKSDASLAALWVTDWSRGVPRQLPTGGSVSEPRFSPDGHAVSYLAARPPTGRTQLWALDVHGGSAHAWCSSCTHRLAPTPARTRAPGTMRTRPGRS